MRSLPKLSLLPMRQGTQLSGFGAGPAAVQRVEMVAPKKTQFVGRRVKVDAPRPEYLGDPVHLTASVVGIQPGGNGGVNVKALKNPTPGMVELSALKFRVRSTGALPSGALVGVRLDLGDFSLTNGFIPVYAFGKAEGLVSEQVGGYAQYVAKLSRPIYLPSGAAIRPQFQHRAQLSVAVDVQVSMYGRRLSPKSALPRRLMLPYWAAYACKPFTLGTADSDISTENDLYNPFDVPMEMERFIGRINYYSGAAFNNANTMTEVEQSLNAAPSGGGPAALGDALGQILCQITDSNGFTVVKKPTPFRLVFDAETRAWPVSHDLPPGGYYIVSMTNNAWIVAAPYAGKQVVAQPIVSMLGWREVR